MPSNVSQAPSALVGLPLGSEAPPSGQARPKKTKRKKPQNEPDASGPRTPNYTVLSAHFPKEVDASRIESVINTFAPIPAQLRRIGFSNLRPENFPHKVRSSKLYMSAVVEIALHPSRGTNLA